MQKANRTKMAPDANDKNAPNPGAIRVAYLINQYPGISHSFVRREIQALERARAHSSICNPPVAARGGAKAMESFNENALLMPV